MNRGKLFHRRWLFTASCLVGVVLWTQLARTAEESSAIFPGLTPMTSLSSGPATSPSPLQKTAFESSSPSRVSAHPNAQGLKSHPSAEGVELSEFEPGQIDEISLSEKATCDEEGEPVPSGRGFIRSPRQFFRLLGRKHWLSSPEDLAKREPWHYRPFGIGLFMGPIAGSPLIRNSVEQETGFLAGGRFGYDFDDDWGVEMRIASASIPTNLDRLLGSNSQYSADHFLWDIDFLYYPWGDAAWRPYVLMGIGTSRIKFTDAQQINQSRILAGMPVGIGVKWKMNDWMVFRLECLDNVAFAGGSVFQTQHNASLTGGLEIRFGRPHIQYWPWNPGMRQ